MVDMWSELRHVCVATRVALQSLSVSYVLFALHRECMSDREQFGDSSF